MQFHELSGRHWNIVKQSLPSPAYTGRPRADDRKTVNGILYVLMSGCRWMDMPAKYGSHKTVWERHKKWSEKGIWKKIMDSLIDYGYQSGIIDINDLSIDSSTIAAKKGGKRLALTDTRKRKEARYTQL